MADRPRVLLLGATGFIGRHVRTALEATGSEVLAVSGIGSRESTWRRLDLVTGDVSALIADAAPDVVVNCTGRTHGELEALEVTNVAVVERLLDALVGRSVRLVHLGSAAEYGPGLEERPTREDDPARPIADYGMTKLRATELVRASGLDAIVLRVFNAIGGGMRPDTMPGRAASLMAEAIAAGTDTITMGDLSARRDFVDARDVGDAVLAACRVSRGPGIVNVGTGRAIPSRVLVATLAEVAGFEGEILEEGVASQRSGSVDYQCAAVEVARRHLGWVAHRTLRESLAELWATRGSVAPAADP